MSLADNIFIDMCKDVMRNESLTSRRERRYVRVGVELRLIPSIWCCEPL